MMQRPSPIEIRVIVVVAKEKIMHQKHGARELSIREKDKWLDSQITLSLTFTHSLTPHSTNQGSTWPSNPWPLEIPAWPSHPLLRVLNSLLIASEGPRVGASLLLLNKERHKGHATRTTMFKSSIYQTAWPMRQELLKMKTKTREVKFDGHIYR